MPLDSERPTSELEALSAENTSLREQLEIVTEIGAQLSAERDLDRLLERILTGARRLTRADAGSLYLVDGTAQDQLRFKLAQNDSVDVPFRETVIALSSDTIVGYVARTRETLCFDDVYELPQDAAYRFSKGFDEWAGYRSKSMLVVPLIDHRDRVLGCLQLINRKPDARTVLRDPEHAEEVVEPFTQSCQSVLASLASQSAVAMDKAKLIKDLEDTFEGLVFASVVAIESRDPTTSGHSERVAQLSVALAKVVSDAGGGKFKDVAFSGAQLKELRYASLLHDFGKVGVQERVLVKAKKLFPTDLEVVRARFACALKDVELATWRTLVEELKHPGRDAKSLIAVAEAEIAKQKQQLRDLLDLVLEANEPRLLPEGCDLRLRAIAQRTYLDEHDHPQPLLREDEVLDLSIPRGSLNTEQRIEIESHVTHTYRFLARIPWTEELRDLPRIAGSHHEKLDGSGYPHGLSDLEIPPQAKIMSVCDIFDALTAWDRPYKKAVPLDRALSILEAEANAGKIETELVDMFREHKLYEPVLRKRPSP
ncbi:MAG: HD domain-containing phosphohydrolase [Planctomycetota bacterium]